MINIVKQYGKPAKNTSEYGASASGTYQVSTTESTSIDIGFKPKYLAIQAAANEANTSMIIYSEDFSTTTYKYATSGLAAQNRTIGDGPDGGRLVSIDDNGFTVYKNSGAASVFTYFALG